MSTTEQSKESGFNYQVLFRASIPSAEWPPTWDREYPEWYMSFYRGVLDVLQDEEIKHLQAKLSTDATGVDPSSVTVTLVTKTLLINATGTVGKHPSITIKALPGLSSLKVETQLDRSGYTTTSVRFVSFEATLQDGTVLSSEGFDFTDYTERDRAKALVQDFIEDLRQQD